MSNNVTKSNLKLDKKAKVLLLNDCIKIITQASWSLKVLSQQFPVQDLTPEDYDQYISLVEDEVVSFAEAVAKMSLILQR